VRHAAVLAASTLLLAAGCGGSSKTSTPPANTAAAASTASAAAPAAHTTAAPAPAAKDAAGVVARLKAAGLPIGTVTVYTADNDPNHLLGRPGGYTSKASFADTRVKADQARSTEAGAVDLGGSVEVYADTAGATARADYIGKSEKSMPMLGTEYDYVSGSVLLRLSQVLTPDQAAAYKKALG